jgi:prepilin-type N-terminal cleavage/methylation domain-containing protein
MVKKNKPFQKNQRGFSLVELLLALTLTLIILGVAVGSFTQAISMRASESSRTDALTSVQAAINIMSREISNSGYGLKTNGIPTDANGIAVDSDERRLHFRANTTNTYPSNTDPGTVNPGEDITYFYDTASKSVVRYDAVTGQTSGVINRVSEVEFGYYDYSGSTFSGPNTIPTKNTGRVVITLTVFMPDVVGQPANQTVTFRTDVTLRNSPYMLGQY